MFGRLRATQRPRTSADESVGKTVGEGADASGHQCADESAGLMARVAAGDRDAFERLLALHLPAIEAFVIRMTQDAALAQDIAQEVLLKAWLNAAEYDAARAKVTTWLHQLAHNACIDTWRKRGRETPLDDHSEWHDAQTGDACCQYRQSDDQRLIKLVLARLPDNQRAALVLTYYQGLSNREAAAALGLNVRALESLLVRARAALRRALSDLGENHED